MTNRLPKMEYLVSVRCVLAVSVILSTTNPLPCHAETQSNTGTDNTVCLSAGKTAENLYGLPEGLLLAIGSVEAGRSLPDAPGLTIWPWTANLKGRPLLLDTREELISVAQSNAGSSLDIGCYQINLYWHGWRFSGIAPERLVDPEANAEFAAQLLTELKATYGSWAKAVRAYHAGTPEKSHGFDYACKVASAWEKTGKTEARFNNDICIRPPAHPLSPAPPPSVSMVQSGSASPSFGKVEIASSEKDKSLGKIVTSWTTSTLSRPEGSTWMAPELRR